MTISDSEFRKRAHALLQLINERWRAAIAPVDLDSCAECGKHGAAHKSDCDLAALLAAGPYRSSVGLRAAIVAELDKDGVSKPYEIAERMDAPFSAVPAIIRDLQLVRRAGDGSFMRPPRKEPV